MLGAGPACACSFTVTVRAWQSHTQANCHRLQPAHLKEAAVWLCPKPTDAHAVLRVAVGHRVAPRLLPGLHPLCVTCSAAASERTPSAPYLTQHQSRQNPVRLHLLPSAPIMTLSRTNTLQHAANRTLYMYSVVLQFPDLYERFDEEYFANPLTEAWFLELERQTKRTFRDPGGYFDCYESGQRRAESLLADGYQPWDLLPLAEVSWRQQTLSGA